MFFSPSSNSQTVGQLLKTKVFSKCFWAKINQKIPFSSLDSFLQKFISDSNKIPTWELLECRYLEIAQVNNKNGVKETDLFYYNPIIINKINRTPHLHLFPPFEFVS